MLCLWVWVSVLTYAHRPHRTKIGKCNGHSVRASMQSAIENLRLNEYSYLQYLAENTIHHSVVHTQQQSSASNRASFPVRIAYKRRRHVCMYVFVRQRAMLKTPTQNALTQTDEARSPADPLDAGNVARCSQLYMPPA